MALVIASKQHDKLHLVCANEVHLFCSFGMSFRSEFYFLKEVLFNNILSSDDVIDDPSAVPSSGTVLKCPLLLMTATATKGIVDQFTLSSGIQLDTSLNVFWQCVHMMCRRERNLIVEHTTNAIARFKERAKNLLEVNDSSKIILYSNSCLKSEKNHKAW
jgi:hypothetical protein